MEVLRIITFKKAYYYFQYLLRGSTAKPLAGRNTVRG